MTENPINESSVSISPAAIDRINTLARKKEAKNLAFRICVSGGGCSGFHYKMGFDSDINKDDIIIEHDGARLVTDQMSLPFLAGATIDYVRDMIGARFEVKNPNAVSGCGCGQSFAI